MMTVLVLVSSTALVCHPVQERIQNDLARRHINRRIVFELLGQITLSR
jgi:hypothetical protein